MVERVTFHAAETGFCVLRVKARGCELIDTAVTRAKRLLVSVGSRKALAIAVRRRLCGRLRWSLLRERLARR